MLVDPLHMDKKCPFPTQLCCAALCNAEVNLGISMPNLRHLDKHIEAPEMQSALHTLMANPPCFARVAAEVRPSSPAGSLPQLLCSLCGLYMKLVHQ